jgi:hypothetical protein
MDHPIRLYDVVLNKYQGKLKKTFIKVKATPR